jgi:hypothetical protein
MSRSHAMLLRTATEEDFTRWCKSLALLYGWNGIHVRWSQAVLEAVHTLRLHGWSEAFGLPDWYWWHEGRGQHFWTELKSWEGRVSQHQRERIASMQKAGETVYIWRPQNEVEIERTFRDGLGV